MASRNRGKSKMKLRDLSRMPLEPSEAQAIGDIMVGMSHPITTAILGSILVEHDLEQALRPRLARQDDETWAILVADNGPLSSLFCKITAGYALGVLNEKTRDSLHVIRNIRNAFAHSKKLIDFDHELIMDELRKASSLYLPISFLKAGKYPQNEAARAGYACLCYRVSCKLINVRTRRAKAKSRYYSRKTARTAPPSALAKALASSLPPPLAGFAGFGPLSSLGRQLFGPTTEAPPGLLSGLAHLGSIVSDKEDKKD